MTNDKLRRVHCLGITRIWMAPIITLGPKVDCTLPMSVSIPVRTVKVQTLSNKELPEASLQDMFDAVS